MTTYQPGDVVRVKTHAPHGTRLLAGDEVTVEVVKTDGDDNVVLLVKTEHGRRALYAADVEPVQLVYRPAQPSKDIDTAFAAIFEAEPDLAGIFDENAATALAAVEEEVSAALMAAGAEDAADVDPDEETEDVNGAVIRFSAPEDDPKHVLNITDAWGDHASFAYQEAVDEEGRTHGRIMIFATSDAGVSLRAEYLPRFIEWLKSKHGRTSSAE